MEGCDDGSVPRSVLVVDDDACFRQLAARILSGWGHAIVGQAGSIEAALALARERRPDTALVDIGLPDGDGFMLAERLRSLPRPVRVVLISTDADRTNASAARRAGACGFVAKDELSGQELRRLIEEG
jgi:CheY-like chemotaxis protein